jgi:hypothetical protein
MSISSVSAVPPLAAGSVGQPDTATPAPVQPPAPPPVQAAAAAPAGTGKAVDCHC